MRSLSVIFPVLYSILMLTSDTFAMVTKEGRKLERITSEEWPRDGPWIVHVKQNEHASVIAQAEAAHKTKKSRLQADAKPLKDLKVKSSWSSEEGLNAIVIDGAHYDDLKMMAGVKAIVPDRILHKEIYNWGTDRLDQQSLPLDQGPYNPFTQGCGVDVFVLDTGIDANHPEFQNRPNGAVTTNIWEGYLPNSSTEKSNPLDVSNPLDLDVDGHGSHVAGTVGGKTVGVARCANIYGMKVLSDFGSGSTSGIVDALNRVRDIHIAKRNPKSVINMSLGGFCGNDCALDPINMKISELKELGIVTVVAAGNEYDDASKYSPASAVDAITTGASDRSDSKAGFSNYGSLVDLYGPGVAIPSVCASRNSYCTGDSWTIDGTSMASPHVAGVAAMQMQKGSAYINMNSALAVEQVTNSLKCDAASGKIVRGNAQGTTTDLVQYPTNDNKWNCVAAGNPPVTPTTAPTTAPSAVPTANPTAVAPPTGRIIPASFPQYQAVWTNSARSLRNSVLERVTICPGETWNFDTCGNYEGDTFLRLRRASDSAQVRWNDDECGLGSTLSWTKSSTDATCEDYNLVQGCYGGDFCRGNVVVTVTNIYNPPNLNVPTVTPTLLPTALPTLTPTALPTATPTIGIPSQCAPFNLVNTQNATTGTEACLLNRVCPGEVLTIRTCQPDFKTCSGDTYLRLYSQAKTEIAHNDDACGVCSSITYTFTEPCQSYVIEQGCYGSGQCGGTTKIFREIIPGRFHTETNTPKRNLRN